MPEPYRPDPPPIHFPETTEDKNLQLLATFHYVVGVIIALFSCIFIIHIAIGMSMLTTHAWQAGSGPAPPTELGYVFVIAGGFAVLFGWTLGALTIFAGRSIAQRKKHLFCLIVAGILCLWVPFGTV